MAKPKKKTKTAKKPAKKAAKAAKKSAKKAAKPAKKPAKKAAKAAKKPAAKKPAAKKPAAKKPAKPSAEAIGGGEIEIAGTPEGGDPGTVPHIGPHGGGDTVATGSNGVPAPHELAKLAMAGDLDAIFAIVDGDAESDRDGLAYKWLAAASDFGHEAADDMIGDLLEASSLRYDDDQLVTGAAHWELGVAYLTGGEGLPRDLEKGRAQLAAALERGFPASIQDSDKEIAEARATFAADALAVFDAVFSEGTSGALDDRGEEDEEEDEGD